MLRSRCFDHLLATTPFSSGCWAGLSVKFRRTYRASEMLVLRKLGASVSPLGLGCGGPQEVVTAQRNPTYHTLLFFAPICRAECLRFEGTLTAER